MLWPNPFRGALWFLAITAVLILVIWATLTYQYRAVTGTIGDSMSAQVQAEVDLVAALVGHEPAATWLSGLHLAEQRRLTVIDPTGRVLFDSQAEASGMDNHNDRPEVIAARRDGVAVVRRTSSTLHHDLLYGARLLADGRVVRIAVPIAFEAGLQRRLSEPMAIAAVLALCAAALVIALQLWRDRTRVAELVSVSRAFGIGDFTRRAGLMGGDTLALLGHELNHLGGRLQSSQQELANSRELLQTALATLAEGVACIDHLDRILYANGAFRQLAAGGAEVAGQPYYEHLPVLTQDQDHALDHRRRQLVARMTMANPEVRVLVLHDRTELMRLENARRDFISSVSHELKTPLTVIQGFTETLLDGALDDAATARMFITKIGQHAERLAVLVRDVLTLSRLEQGAWDVKPRATDLARLGRELLDEYQPTAASQRTTLHLEAPGELPATTDPELLRHLVGNLLSNAIRYNRPDGHVWVAFDAADNDRVRITVRDTGIGIPAEHRDRIFERFYRVDTHRSRQTGGTGLGLSIVKQLLDALDGSITLDSSADGSVFTVLIPRTDVRVTLPVKR